MKEAMAAGKRIEIGLTTRAEEVVAYDGGDWETKHRQSARETADRVRDGLQPPANALPNGQTPGGAPGQSTAQQLLLIPANPAAEPEPTQTTA
jgi:capsid protein